jgi:hypothetical protein
MAWIGSLLFHVETQQLPEKHQGHCIRADAGAFCCAWQHVIFVFRAAVVAYTSHRKRIALDRPRPIGAYIAQSNGEYAAAVEKRV